MAQSDMVSGIVIKKDAVKSLPSVSSIPGFSVPPSGMFRVVNIYINPNTGKLAVEYDNTPVP